MIGENLQKLRKQKKLSLRALAEKANISKSTLSDIENDNTNPTITTLGKIAKALEVTLDELMKSEPVTKEQLNEWDEKCANLKESKAPYITGSSLKGAIKTKFIEMKQFKSAEAAMQFILKQPSVMGYGGFDTNKMSDEEIVEFANELLRQLKLISYKYKK